MTEKKFNCRDQALDKLINEAKEKIRQDAKVMSYADLRREFKKAQPRIDKYLKELRSSSVS